MFLTQLKPLNNFANNKEETCLLCNQGANCDAFINFRKLMIKRQFVYLYRFYKNYKILKIYNVYKFYKTTMIGPKTLEKYTVCKYLIWTLSSLVIWYINENNDF